MENGYEINVTLNGKPFFSTKANDHYATSQRVANNITKRFPASEGFSVSMTYHYTDTRDVEIQKVYTARGE